MLKAFSKLLRFVQSIGALEQRVMSIQEAVGRIEFRQMEGRSVPASLQAREFQVYSQWGEDGILQYLVSRLPNRVGKFVEFGVESYSEANTRFLLANNNWDGLVIDGSSANIETIKNSPIYWRRGLKAVHAFITAENINQLVSENGFSGEIDVLSIDIDGNDYWVWKALTVATPRIVVVEYNWRFGPERSVTVPYDPGFIRSNAHTSCVYFGASLAALTKLGASKGYALVGVTSSGLNAFFVRRDVMGTLEELTVESAFIAGKFKEARDRNGNLTLISPDEEAAIVQGLPVIRVD